MAMVTLAVSSLVVFAAVVVACSSNHSGDSKAFCAKSQEAAFLGARIQQLTLESPGIRTSIAKAAHATDEAAAEAPAAIHADARSLAKAVDDFDSAARHAPDANALGTAFDDYRNAIAQQSAAANRVDAWLAGHCTAGSTTTSSSTTR
jgi:hypothetical protein